MTDLRRRLTKLETAAGADPENLALLSDAELEARLAELVRQSGGKWPMTPDEHADRLAELQRMLAADEEPHRVWRG